MSSHPLEDISIYMNGKSTTRSPSPVLKTEKKNQNKPNSDEIHNTASKQSFEHLNSKTVTQPSKKSTGYFR